ncbi:MAG: phenylalanine--tRNA ligase subunit alpha, partial [Nitrospinota bacterium]|nr:phenylalanine--tRNA ligase subunit alpha [Nitrospinota bacterium]
MTSHSLMLDDLEKLKAGFLSRIASADSLPELAQARVELLGKKSELTGLLKGLGKLAAQDRPMAGKAINDLRVAVETALEQKISTISRREMVEKLENETFDITLPGRHAGEGGFHPIGLVMEELIDIFAGLGYMVEEGPEIETDERNFKMLNFPDDHPAR